MSIVKSMQTSVSGLTANSEGMSVIANNIANSNTKGYKYERSEFEDMLSVDLQSGDGQIGRGVKLGGVKVIHSQGSIQTTDSLSDLAIHGNGFFIVSNPRTDTKESGGVTYTRAGNFIFDKDGYLSDNLGGHVQGYMADNHGNLSPKLSDIKISANTLNPAATSKVKLNVNLDSRTQLTTNTPFDINKAEDTCDYCTSTNVLDSQGTSHPMMIYFKKLESAAGGSTWEWHATVDSEAVTDPVAGQALKEIGSGKVTFDEDGVLKKEETTNFSVNFINGAKPNQVMDIDFGDSLEEGGKGVGASTALAADSETIFHSQDGYTACHLKSLKIDYDGSVVGFYTNGLQRTIGSIALATFENNTGLKKAGHNQFYATYKSGEANIGRPASGTRGGVYSASLEESNVDLAKQFVDMIMTQRAFQANSKTITTGDTMLEEIINIRR